MGPAVTISSLQSLFEPINKELHDYEEDEEAYDEEAYDEEEYDEEAYDENEILLQEEEMSKNNRFCVESFPSGATIDGKKKLPAKKMQCTLTSTSEKVIDNKKNLQVSINPEDEENLMFFINILQVRKINAQDYLPFQNVINHIIQRFTNPDSLWNDDFSIMHLLPKQKRKRDASEKSSEKKKVELDDGKIIKIEDLIIIIRAYEL